MPLAGARGAIGQGIVLAGLSPDGRTVVLRSTDGGGWQRIAPPGQVVPATVALRGDALFLASDVGRQWRWTAASGWVARARVPARLLPGIPARPIGQSALLSLLQDAEGARLFGYNTITDAWSPIGAAGPVPPVATPSGTGFATVIGRGSQAAVGTLTPELQRRPLGWLYRTIVVVYLVAMLGVGFHFWRRSRMGSTSEFFLGSRAIPFWAARCSRSATWSTGSAFRISSIPPRSST